MAWTQTDIDNIKAALATGARRITHEGVTIEYLSREEMLKQLADMELAVNGTVGKIRRIRFQAIKGL